MNRVHVALAASAFVLPGSFPLAGAWPSLYSSTHGGCEIPDQAYGAHQAPTEDPAITFELTSAAGEAVTEWTAGAAYTLTVSPYDATSTTNAWVHASAGTLTPADASTHRSAAACDAAVFSAVRVSGAHTVTWTAPVDDSVCVTVSSAQATGAAAGYATGMATLPGANAPPCDGSTGESTGDSTGESTGESTGGTLVVSTQENDSQAAVDVAVDADADADHDGHDHAGDDHGGDDHDTQNDESDHAARSPVGAAAFVAAFACAACMLAGL